MNDEIRGQSCDWPEVPAPLPENPVPAMAYVPFQQWSQELLGMEEALCAGTLFPVLEKPFCGRRAQS